MAEIKRTREIPVYDNKYLTLFDDEVEFPGGVAGKYVRARWKCAFGVGIVPITPQREILLIEQFCYACQRSFLQIPKGMGKPNTPPEQMAAAELREELGAVCAKLVPMTVLYVDPGFFENPTHIFLALDTDIIQAVEHESSEVILGVHRIGWDEWTSPKTLSRIVDPLTISSLFLARRYLETADAE